MGRKTDNETDEMIEVNDDVIIKLSQTYNFEGDEISELDFSGIDSVTVEDMIQASNILTRSGRTVAIPEMDLQYTLYIAHVATGRPIEFFNRLKPRDAIRVKNRVTGYFFGRG